MDARLAAQTSVWSPTSARSSRAYTRRPGGVSSEMKDGDLESHLGKSPNKKGGRARRGGVQASTPTRSTCKA